jgi:RNAse (barnase) inhibitor barstar
VCFWEDDPAQFEDIDNIEGANGMSLRQAQRNFLEFGAIKPELVPLVRHPSSFEQRDVGWQPYMLKTSSKFLVIDLNGIQSREDLHELFQEKLKFPDFYGRNWDAFRDSITGLVEMPETLLITGFESLKCALPRDARILEEIVADYNGLGFTEIVLQ